MPISTAVMATALLGALLEASCGSGTEDPATRTPAALSPTAEVPPVMSAFEQSVLSDDLLDEAEYDLAFNLYGACVLEAGGRFEPEAQKNARGTWNFGVHVPPLRPALSNDEAILGVEDCSAQYFDAVHERWTAEHLPLHAEVEAAKAGIVQCMRDRGIEMPEDLPDGWGQAYFGKLAPAGLRTDREAGQAFADAAEQRPQGWGMGQMEGWCHKAAAFVDPNGWPKLH